MPIVYPVAVAPPRPPQVIDPTDLSGEDISLSRGDLTETAAGDWGTLAFEAAARQSVEREAVASPGDMPRRPDWGMGIRNMLMRGATVDARDRAAADVRRRLNANPRIERVETVDVAARTDLATSGVVTVTIGAFVRGQRITFTTTTTPRGAR